MFNSKETQRAKIKSDRLKLSDAEYHEKSHIICDTAQTLAAKRKIKRAHVYLPIEANKEVDTWPLVKALLNNGISVSTSIFGESRSLKHVILQADTVYDYDELGIPVPTKNYTQGEEQYDIVFVPLVGFDSKLRRLGYGRGVYDTYLKKQPNSYKVGLAFEVQKVKRIKTEKHDEKLDAIITELKLYN